MVGPSIFSGSHVPLVREVMEKLRGEGLNIPVVVGGIIPPEDEELLKKSGVAAVFTPKNYELNRILTDIVKIVERLGGEERCVNGNVFGIRAASRLAQNNLTKI